MIDPPSGLVLPSREDPVVRAASEVVGGPAGRQLRVGGSWWTPVRVLLVLVFLTSGLGMVAKAHCRAEGWSRPDPDQYVHQCYSDIPLLYFTRGLDSGTVPYLDDVPQERAVEYPVLTGVVMGLTAALVPGTQDPRRAARWYFDINVILLALCSAVTVVATARTAGRRPWDAAMFALAPGLALAGTINWDLWAVALTGLALWAWARERPVLAGVLLGLGTATKFYPLLLFGPLFLLGLRAGRLRAVATAAGAGALAWLAVNVPVMVANYDNWKLFYAFSRERGASFGSIWYALSLVGAGLSGSALNAVALATFLVACLGIAILALTAPRRPRLAQVAFLTVAAFLLTNKVYSPQYVVWLIPFAALARPRWRDYLVWQFCEVVHFVATWLFLEGIVAPDQANRSLGTVGYVIAVALHVLGTLWLVALVVRDVRAPEHDPVRADGSDDPGGGVFDHVPDTPRMPLRRPAPAPAPAG